MFSGTSSWQIPILYLAYASPYYAPTYSGLTVSWSADVGGTLLSILASDLKLAGASQFSHCPSP